MHKNIVEKKMNKKNNNFYVYAIRFYYTHDAVKIVTNQLSHKLFTSRPVSLSLSICRSPLANSFFRFANMNCFKKR